jgi:opacity protein-like surface antigen
MKLLACLALTAVGMTSFTENSAAQVTGFKIFAALAYVAPLSDSNIDVGGVVDAVGASSELGYNFGLEYRMSSLLGVELDYWHTAHDLEGETEGVIGSTTFSPICATLNFHLPILFNLYGGPTIGYVNWGDLELESGLNQDVDPAFAYGLSAGVELPLLPKVSLMGGLRWLDVKAQAEDSEEVDVNPLLVRLGATLSL